jgi:hypothetical protein
LGDISNASTGFIWEETLWRGVSNQSQNPTAIYRLGIDIGEGSEREVLLGSKILGELTIARGS